MKNNKELGEKQSDEGEKRKEKGSSCSFVVLSPRTNVENNTRKETKPNIKGK